MLYIGFANTLKTDFLNEMNDMLELGPHSR